MFLNYSGISLRDRGWQISRHRRRYCFEGPTKVKRKSLQGNLCPVARALDVIGDWWSLLIIYEAVAGPKRFGELQRNLGVAKNIFATRLKALSWRPCRRPTGASIRNIRSQLRAGPCCPPSWPWRSGAANTCLSIGFQIWEARSTSTLYLVGSCRRVAFSSFFAMFGAGVPFTRALSSWSPKSNFD